MIRDARWSSIRWRGCGKSSDETSSMLNWVRSFVFETLPLLAKYAMASCTSVFRGPAPMQPLYLDNLMAMTPFSAGTKLEHFGELGSGQLFDYLSQKIPDEVHDHP